jgi:F0F1-type ATP synthase assembly protein I
MEEPEHLHTDELEQLASRTGPWLLVALLLLGFGVGAFVWALTPANSALRTPPESRR